MNYIAAKSISSLEVSAEAEVAYTAEIDERSALTVWLTGCRSWYVDQRSGRLTLLWPGTAVSFRERNGTFDPGPYVVRRSEFALRVRVAADEHWSGGGHRTCRRATRRGHGAQPALDDVVTLLSCRGADLAELQSVAARLRDEGWRGRTSGPDHLLAQGIHPLTRLCRDRCHYCTFVTVPGKLRREGHGMYPRSIRSSPWHGRGRTRL